MEKLQNREAELETLETYLGPEMFHTIIAKKKYWSCVHPPTVPPLNPNCRT